jgi:hypothetical protein
MWRRNDPKRDASMTCAPEGTLFLVTTTTSCRGPRHQPHPPWGSCEGTMPRKQRKNNCPDTSSPVHRQPHRHLKSKKKHWRVRYVTSITMVQPPPSHMSREPWKKTHRELKAQWSRHPGEWAINLVRARPAFGAVQAVRSLHALPVSADEALEPQGRVRVVPPRLLQIAHLIRQFCDKVIRNPHSCPPLFQRFYTPPAVWVGPDSEDCRQCHHRPLPTMSPTCAGSQRLRMPTRRWHGPIPR